MAKLAPTSKRTLTTVNGPVARDVYRITDDPKQEKQKVELACPVGLTENERELEIQSRIHTASGSMCQQVGLHLLTKICEAIALPHASLEETVGILNTLAKEMQSMQPRDEIEGHLIAQLVVLHEQCMTWLGKANRTENIGFVNVYFNGASKLLVRHHETLAALLKYRRGDEQRVHVEHVHIHNGGRAIVGNVEMGGGGKQKTEEGPHAKV